MTLVATPGTIAAVLEVAAGEEGYVEQGGPHGNDGNVTKYWADTFPSFQGASWCADFVSWVFIYAGCRLPAIDHQFGFTYCPDLVAMGRQQGWTIPGPMPGAIVLYIENGIAAHTGICRSFADAAGNFQTTEGNTSSGDGGSQSNGGGVYRRTRNVRGFGQGCVFVMPPVYKNITTPTFVLPEEDDMRIPAPDANSPRDAKGRPYVEAILIPLRGKKGLVVIGSDRSPADGANVRVAKGNDRNGPFVGTVLPEAWVPSHRFETPFDQSSGDEVIPVTNYGPNAIGATLEYAA